MGRLYQRGGAYYADLRAEGRGRISLHTTDRVVAKSRLRAAELGAGPAAVGGGQYLATAIDQMIATKRDQTADSYRWRAQPLVRELGETTRLEELTRARVVEYVATRRADGVRSHTIHKELVVLRQALKEAAKRGEYAGGLDVVPAIAAEYTPRTRWLTVDEVRRLVDYAPPDRRTWILLQVYTSANKSEVSRITWEHVDVTAGTVHIPGTKRAQRDRVVPMHPELAGWLRTRDRCRPLVEPWVKVNAWLRAACKTLGMPHVSTNDLRRTFAAALKQAGVDSLPVAHMMGHSSTTMIERVYGRLSRATYEAAIARMPGHTGGTQIGKMAKHKAKKGT